MLRKSGPLFFFFLKNGRNKLHKSQHLAGQSFNKQKVVFCTHTHMQAAYCSAGDLPERRPLCVIPLHLLLLRRLVSHHFQGICSRTPLIPARRSEPLPNCNVADVRSPVPFFPLTHTFNVSEGCADDGWVGGSKGRVVAVWRGGRGRSERVAAMKPLPNVNVLFFFSRLLFNPRAGETAF